MSKESRFRGSFDKQHGKGDQTLWKPEPHNLCHIYWSLWRQLGWKKCLLVIWKILGLFVKILNADHKYSLLYRENLKKPIQMQLSQKQKFIFQFVSAFLKSRLTFEHFQKKWWPSWQLYLRNCRLQKTWLNKSLKSPISEDRSTSNRVIGTKHC